MKYLGVDYGKRKIGLALSEGELARPWKVIEVTGLKDAIQKMTHIVQAEEIDEIVVGQAESGESRRMVEEWSSAMSLIVKTTKTTETLSSFHAVKTMITIGQKRGERRSDDAQAAAIILQDYLDREEK
mgnify:CR=1 FL=1